MRWSAATTSLRSSVVSSAALTVPPVATSPGSRWLLASSSSALVLSVSPYITGSGEKELLMLCSAKFLAEIRMQPFSWTYHGLDHRVGYPIDSSVSPTFVAAD